MNADGSGQTRLTISSSFRDVHEPAWSPDGTQIAFQGATTLYVIDADGTDEHRLNSTYLGSMEAPTWSPDGSTLVFSGLSPSPEPQFGLFQTNSDGIVTRLTTGRDADPAWAPDGSAIAYTHPPLGAAPDIFTIKPDGTGAANLTQTDTDENEPAWSPDGTKLAFHSDPLINNIDIYTVNADGTGKQRLTTDPAHDIRPAWQPVADDAPPEVQCGSADGFWHASNVSIGCTATDPGTGLADPAQASFSMLTSVASGTEDANASTGSVSVCDNAGNCTTAGPLTGNRVDRRAPGISITAPAAQVYLLKQSVAAAYSCSDPGSGASSCSGPVASGAGIDTASVGTKTFTVAAADNVGNTDSQSVSYVVAYAVAQRSDPSKPRKKVVVQLRDAGGAKVSTQVVLSAVSIDSGAPVSGTFSFNPRTAKYSYTLPRRGLSTGAHTLQFIAGADPTVHSVPFVAP